ncbi:hypothetical protein ACH4MT_32445 [Streptomyces anulatus]
MPVAAAGVGPYREAVAAEVDPAECRGQQPLCTRPCRSRPQRSGTTQGEERGGQRTGVQAQTRGHLWDSERAGERVLVGERERVGGPRPVTRQDGPLRTGRDRFGQTGDGPADRIGAVPLAGAEQHGEIEALRTADGLMRPAGQQIRQAGGDADTEHGCGPGADGQIVQFRHGVEQPPGGADVNHVDAALKTCTCDGRVRRLDAHHHCRHVTQPVQHLPEADRVAHINPYAPVKTGPGLVTPAGDHPPREPLGERGCHRLPPRLRSRRRRESVRPGHRAPL